MIIQKIVSQKKKKKKRRKKKSIIFKYNIYICGHICMWKRGREEERRKRQEKRFF